MTLLSDCARISAALLFFLLPCLTGCGSLATREEESLGRQFALEAKRTLPLLRDRAIDEFVAEMGLALVKASGPQPFRYRFYVVADESPNAFAAPAGHIYLHTGTVLMARSAAELAAVLAHEIGHVVHRHVIKYKDLLSQARYREIAGEERRRLHHGPRTGAHETITAIYSRNCLSHFSQEHEMEADRFAVSVLQRAGYDPEALASIMASLLRTVGAASADLYASHPPISRRINAVYAQIENLPSGERQPPAGRGRLLDIQQRVKLLTGHTTP